MKYDSGRFIRQIGDDDPLSVFGHILGELGKKPSVLPNIIKRLSERPVMPLGSFNYAKNGSPGVALDGRR